jgi:hypothetical protein
MGAHRAFKPESRLIAEIALVAPQEIGNRSGAIGIHAWIFAHYFVWPPNA